MPAAEVAEPQDPGELDLVREAERHARRISDRFLGAAGEVSADLLCALMPEDPPETTSPETL